MHSRLKILRERANLTQAQAAEMLGMSQPHYSNLEKGKRVLSSPHLVKLGEIYGIPPHEVIFDPSDDDDMYFLKKLRSLEDADRRVVLELVKSLADKSNPPDL